MIEANKLIFPFPKYSQQSQNLLNHFKNNVIYIPKRVDPPIGCFCHDFIPNNNYSHSEITTSRQAKSYIPSQITSIHSSKHIKMKMLQPKHKRSDTKLLNIVAGKYQSAGQKVKTSIQTPRERVFEQKDHLLKVPKIVINAVKSAKVRHKFLSADLFQQQQSEQFSNIERIQTVRISVNKNRYCFDTGPTSSLWNYQKNEGGDHHIPCLYFQKHDFNSKIIVYFHGNGQDIAGCYSFLKNLSHFTRLSLLAVEYPGYSLYQGSPSSEKIEKDGLDVVQFLKNTIGFQAKDIMIIGRSIGSGPAVHVSSIYKIGGLVLLSPFLSLCDAVNDLYGKVASNILKQRFNNRQKAKEVLSPCMIIHGAKDRLISQKHSTELSQYFKGLCITKIVKDMSHSMFNHQQFFEYVNEFQTAIEFNI